MPAPQVRPCKQCAQPFTASTRGHRFCTPCGDERRRQSNLASGRRRRSRRTDEEREQQREYHRQYGEAHRERLRSYKWDRYHNNPDYRQRVIARASSAESRARANARRRERYRTDAEYRARLYAQSRLRPRAPRKHIPALFTRDGFLCKGCLTPFPNPRDGRAVHVDHIIPRVKGGGNDIANLQLLCAQCNLRKGADSPTMFANS